LSIACINGRIVATCLTLTQTPTAQVSTDGEKKADINGKPQFLKIHFHTFRHVRGTLDVRDGVPLLELKERLGHRYIANTEKYVHWKSQYYHEEDNKFYSASVSTDEEADKLIENGWKWELTNPNTGRMHFEKPRFK
jgi:hypothetical protein